MQPLVSIICTTYNHEKYISNALEGFLMQKTSFPFEIIIHDDASTDSTPRILMEYEKKYPHLFRNIYQKDNRYSKGIDIWANLFQEFVEGKYIAICEGDDYWIDPLKLQKQVDFLEANSNYSMCFHNAIKYYINRSKVEIFNTFSHDCDLNIHEAIHEWYVPTASILVRASIVRNYPKWLCHIYSGDYSLILLSINAGKIRYINGIMSVYRISDVGCSVTALLKNQYVFILEQHKLLLNSFDRGTNGKYSVEINNKIECINDEIIFQKAKRSWNVFLLLFIPKKVISRIIKKILH